MKKRHLGRMGFMVSEIGLGAWAIGGRGYGPVPEREAEEVVETYLSSGGNFIDTARNYGESERIIGSVVERLGCRESVFLTTKTSKTASVEEAREIRPQLEHSLELLRTDVIDLYYLHSPPENPETMREVIGVFEELKGEGKIRSIGASIKGPDVNQHTVDLCRQYVDTGKIDALQIIFSIFRQKNREAIRYAAGHNVGIVARTVLESGFLTGKYSSQTSFGSEDHRRRWGGERLARLLEEAETVASWAVVPPFRSLSETAIRFALSEPGVSTVIPGARNASQIGSNVAAATTPALEAQLLDRLRRTYANFTECANTGE